MKEKKTQNDFSLQKCFQNPLSAHLNDGQTCMGRGREGGKRDRGLRRRGKETEKYETHRQLTHEKKLTP